MKRGDMFARLMEEYGSQEENMNEDPVTDKQAGSSAVAGEAKKATQKRMQDEERLTGAVTWSVYSKYIAYAGGWPIVPLFLLAMMYQGAHGGFKGDERREPQCVDCFLVANTIVLGLWTSSSIHGFTQGDYMGTYAALGVGSGLFAFALSWNLRRVNRPQITFIANLTSSQYVELDRWVEHVQESLLGCHALSGLVLRYHTLG